MSEADRWVADIMRASKDRAAALVELHRQLRESGQLGRFVVHRYMCSHDSICQIAEVFRIGGLTLCAVRDYKYSPGFNAQVSVPSARKERTLDGDRHWPGHVYDVEELAKAPGLGIAAPCRHQNGALDPKEMLDMVRSVRPGKPRKPTRL